MLDAMSQEGIRVACEAMGCAFQSTDRFATLAIGYLTCKYEAVHIERRGDQWFVKSGLGECLDDTLAVALAAVVIESTFGDVLTRS